MLVAIPARLPLQQPAGSDRVASLSVRLPAIPGDTGAQEPGATAANTSDTPGVGAANHAATAVDAPGTEGDSILAIPRAQYFGPLEVTERAVPLENPLARETAALRDFPGYGKLILVLYLSESGMVDDVELAGSDIGAPDVERQIIRQLGESRFMPARIEGIPVKSRIKIEVVIKPAISGFTSLD